MNNFSEIASIARQLMNDHGLGHWTFEWDRAKRRAGCCKHRRQTITLSSYYVSHNSIKDIRNTILHEIAHALAGKKVGHGLAWKTICIRIGAKPERCYGEHIDMPKGRYQAICGGCQYLYHRHRIPRGSYVCMRCKQRIALVWTDTLIQVTV